MINETKINLHEQTRERLLAAARVVFSENGFQNATVREICRHAEVNIAAVNYYFSSKEALFAATLNFEPLLVLLCHKKWYDCNLIVTDRWQDGHNQGVQSLYGSFV